MAVNPVSGTPQSTGTSAISSLSQNIDTFLLLLTAQLQNQDPLSPMETAEFTNQLVQFANVEQSIRQTQSLEDLIALQLSFQAQSSVNYIGKAIDVNGDALILQDGVAKMEYSLEGPAAKTTITIRNQAGEVVRKIDGELTPGWHSFEWDGKDADGDQLPDGIYSATVEAMDKSQKAVKTESVFTAMVTGVTFSEGLALLQAGGLEIPLSHIRSVRGT